MVNISFEITIELFMRQVVVYIWDARMHGDSFSGQDRKQSKIAALLFPNTCCCYLDSVNRPILRAFIVVSLDFESAASGFYISSTPDPILCICVKSEDPRSLCLISRAGFSPPVYATSVFSANDVLGASCRTGISGPTR